MSGQSLTIRLANIEDIPAIQAMADVVFRKTYADILSPEQMEYMIDWMYSESSLQSQIGGEGRSFFIASNAGVPCGYISVDTEDPLPDGRKLFHLQKIYVMPDSQGRGIGEFMFRHLVNFLKDNSYGGFRVELNVNRNNPAVHFYEKMGMRCDRQGDFPIGKGFYMNDFIYVLDVDEQ